MNVAPVEVGIAHVSLAGEVQSGDRCFVHRAADRAVIAVIDGLGHGAGAANAADAACAALELPDGQSLSQLMLGCHERLRGTRGAAMTLVELDFKARRLEWIGVGNIVVVLVRQERSGKLGRTELLARGGVVGVSMPTAVAYGLRIIPGDLLVAATDGVKIAFVDDIVYVDQPQRLADRLLARHQTGRDDALVMVAQLNWGTK